uniref:Uncharacterized protein n=1 Tax=viral metagenome TaxID=1070528 RepID=A0A6C0F945_9ZZZZ
MAPPTSIVLSPNLMFKTNESFGISSSNTGSNTFT